MCVVFFHLHQHRNQYYLRWSTKKLYASLQTTMSKLWSRKENPKGEERMQKRPRLRGKSDPICLAIQVLNLEAYRNLCQALQALKDDEG